MIPVKSPGLWVMTNRRLAGYREHFEIAREAIRGGGDVIVMREEAFDEEEFIEEALKVREVCDPASVPVLACDNLNAAFVAGLAGVCLLKEKGRAEEARRLLGPECIVAVMAADGVTVENAGSGTAGSAAGILVCDEAMDKKDIEGACRKLKNALKG
jgi:thiamine monophosphate synthase